MSGAFDIFDRSGAALRLCIVYGFLLLLFFLSVAHLSIPVLTKIKPLFLLMGLYYWTIYRPRILPFYLVFIIGMAFDLLTYAPLGLHTFMYMVIAFVLRGQRRFFMGQPFIMVWMGFVMTAILATFGAWFLYGLAQFRFPDVAPVAGQVIISALLYPVVSVALNMTHRGLMTAKAGYP